MARLSALNIFPLLIAAMTISLVMPSNMFAAELVFQCRWTGGDTGREKEVDVLVVDLAKQKLDFFIRNHKDGWSYSKGKPNKVWDGPDTVDIRRSAKGLITAAAFRADIPTIVTLDEQTGRLSWIYVSGAFVRHYEFSCVKRSTK